ncbi:MAG: hypothetical protein A2Y33_03415 [Spirochaetes bacterium GWF1_51_8]|nr:MAG: hypothetical protein A2Y33_03415 [Spirochaetes bacterium GWF1_51_8]
MRNKLFCSFILFAGILLLLPGCQSGDKENKLHIFKNGIRTTNSVFYSAPVTNTLLDSALIDASRTKNTNKILELLKQGASPDAADKEGRTVLMKAAMHGNLDVVKILIEAGADIEAEDEKGNTALFWTADTQVFKYLLQRGADITHENHQGDTILRYAMLNQDPDILKALKDKKINIDFQNQFGKTLLIKAAEKNDIGFMKFLLENGADIDFQDNNKKTAIIYAMDSHSFDAWILLEKHGAKIDYTLGDLNDNLVFASTAGNLKAVKKLVALGANPDLPPSEKDWDLLSPLMMAAKNNHMDVVRYLVEHGANVNQIKEYDASSASVFTFAFGSGNMDMVEYLLSKGARVDSGCLFGAVTKKSYKKVIYLLENGADVNIQCYMEYFSPLMYAVLHDDIKMVKLLVKHGADVNAVTFSSPTTTPLSIAIRLSNTAIIEYLKSKGATN